MAGDEKDMGMMNEAFDNRGSLTGPSLGSIDGLVPLRDRGSQVGGGYKRVLDFSNL